MIGLNDEQRRQAIAYVLACDPWLAALLAHDEVGSQIAINLADAYRPEGIP